MSEILDSVGSGSAQRIGFGPRLGAYLIDIVIVVVLSFIIGPMIGSMIGMGVGAGVDTTGMSAEEAEITRAAAGAVGGVFGAIAGLMIAAPIIATVYFLIEGFVGFTLGKLMLGIQIANQDGTKAEITSYLIRYAVKNSGSLLSLVGALLKIGILGTLGMIASLAILVGCFFVLGENKQAFQDMAAKTAVFKKTDIHNG